jgi:hypothetical protein
MLMVQPHLMHPPSSSNTSHDSLLERLLRMAFRPPGVQWFTPLTYVLALGVLWLSAFTLLKLPCLLPSPLHLHAMQNFGYSMQWLAVASIFTIMGPRHGTVIWFVLLGTALFLPVFAMGGGWFTWLQPGMMFVPAATIAAITLGTQWERVLHRLYLKPAVAEKATRKKGWFLLKAFILAFWCVCALHFFMICGVGLLTVLKTMTLYEARLWWLVHGWHAFPYDVLFTTVLLISVRWLRVCLSTFLMPVHAFVRPWRHRFSDDDEALDQDTYEPSRIQQDPSTVTLHTRVSHG